MFRLLQPFKIREPAPELVTDGGELTGKVRDPQYRPPADRDGWIGDPPPGSPEYRAWQRWLNS